MIYVFKESGISVNPLMVCYFFGNLGVTFITEKQSLRNFPVQAPTPNQTVGYNGDFSAKDKMVFSMASHWVY